MVVQADVLDRYSGTLTAAQRVKDYDESEFVLYRNSLVEATGDWVAALKHLDANREWVVDEVGRSA
jgi:hypothetical protein